MIVALALALLVPACAHRPKHGNQWNSLFNGRDLSGWTVKCRSADRGKTFWTVDQGNILCDSMGRKDHDYVWLLTEQDTGILSYG